MRALFPMALLIVGIVAQVALAGECCHHCGCSNGVRKVCRVTCDVKKVPETTYSCECEDFCVPGKSARCGTVCEVDCDGCEACKPNWVPQCASVYTRTKLKKTTVDKEKKVYKWVVDYVCDDCCARCAATPTKEDSWLTRSLFNK